MINPPGIEEILGELPGQVRMKAMCDLVHDKTFGQTFGVVGWSANDAKYGSFLKWGTHGYPQIIHN